MLFEYKGVHASLRYCAQTKCYYGELEHEDQLIVYMASLRQAALQALQEVVDGISFLENSLCRSRN